MAERSTAEIFRSEATGNPKDIRFIHNGADWELANSRDPFAARLVERTWWMMSWWTRAFAADTTA